jgi:hypothetical protein
MPATPITATTRYFDVAKTKCVWVPTIASPSLIYTRVELNAGTDLSDEVADLEGFTVTGAEIDVPDFGSLFTGKIPGRTEAEDSSLTFYADETGVDVRGLLTRGASGYVVWLDGGDVEDNISAVFPVRIRSVSVMRSAGEDAARVQVQFSIIAEPNENVPVPAAA